MSKTAKLVAKCEWLFLISHVNTNISKLANFVGLNIVHILQHFTTKLCTFTHSKMLLLAVVLDFVLLA